MKEVVISGPWLLILAVFVLWLGKAFTSRVAVLSKYSIPIAVTGGLVFSLGVLALQNWGGVSISFDLEIRDSLLIVFFSTIGISAKFSRLAVGGKALATLTICAGVFLVVQNVTGVLLAMLVGAHPGIGLFAGSVSLAGGHGTAIAWGQEAAEAGIKNAELAGIAFATFGLVAGGIIGGPLAERFIKKNNLETPGVGESNEAADAPETVGEAAPAVGVLGRVMPVLLILAVCMAFGEIVNVFLSKHNFKVPGFLTAMLVGIIITNLADRWKRPLYQPDYANTGEVCLQLFLAMSLMSMDLSSLQNGLGIIFLVLCIQIAVITIFANLVIFRVMGRNYDAAVISAGFCGLGMGATPVAIANMNAVTSKYGNSFKAFLVVPLVGAFFVDIMNAVIIKFFLGMPFMQVG